MKVKELTWSKPFTIGTVLVRRTRVLRPIEYERADWHFKVREHVVLQCYSARRWPIRVMRKNARGAGYVSTKETIEDVVQLAFFLLGYRHLDHHDHTPPAGTEIDRRIPRR